MINGSLCINPHQIFSGIENFSGDCMTLVYGTNDPSYDMAKLFSEDETTDKINFFMLEGIDHNFTNNLEKFISLPSEYFFS